MIIGPSYVDTRRALGLLSSKTILGELYVWPNKLGAAGGYLPRAGIAAAPRCDGHAKSADSDPRRHLSAARVGTGLGHRRCHLRAARCEPNSARSRREEGWDTLAARRGFRFQIGRARREIVAGEIWH